MALLEQPGHDQRTSDDLQDDAPDRGVPVVPNIEIFGVHMSTSRTIAPLAQPDRDDASRAQSQTELPRGERGGQHPCTEHDDGEPSILHETTTAPSRRGCGA